MSQDLITEMFSAYMGSLLLGLFFAIFLAMMFYIVAMYK